MTLKPFTDVSASSHEHVFAVLWCVTVLLISYSVCRLTIVKVLLLVGAKE